MQALINSRALYDTTYLQDFIQIAERRPLPVFWGAAVLGRSLEATMSVDLNRIAGPEYQC